MKTVRGEIAFWKSWHMKFSKVHTMTPKWTQIIWQSTYAPPSTRRSNLHPFRSLISRLQNVTHFTMFPLMPLLNFQCVTKLQGNSLYSLHGKQCPHKVWMRSDENFSRNSVLKFPAPYRPVKKLFMFGRSPWKVIDYIPYDYHILNYKQHFEIISLS